MQALKDIPDKYFELAIVDPPYGGGGDEQWENKATGRFGNKDGRFERYLYDKVKIDGTIGHGKAKRPRWVGDGGKIDHRAWDFAPPKEYFDELFRVSQNQIIWGGNYFDLPPTRCFVVWRKLTISESFSMAMCEYAWTSFNSNAKCFECIPQGDKKDPRFHPTQKPVQLYEWLLHHYAKKGDKILDTHAGSASSLVACQRSGHEYMGFEIDKRYCDKANKRLDEVRKQVSMWE